MGEFRHSVVKIVFTIHAANECPTAVGVPTRIIGEEILETHCHAVIANIGGDDIPFMHVLYLPGIVASEGETCLGAVFKCAQGGDGGDLGCWRD